MSRRRVLWGLLGVLGAGAVAAVPVVAAIGGQSEAVQEPAPAPGAKAPLGSTSEAESYIRAGGREVVHGSVAASVRADVAGVGSLTAWTYGTVGGRVEVLVDAPGDLGTWSGCPPLEGDVVYCGGTSRDDGEPQVAVGRVGRGVASVEVQFERGMSEAVIGGGFWLAIVPGAATPLGTPPTITKVIALAANGNVLGSVPGPGGP